MLVFAVMFGRVGLMSTIAGAMGLYSPQLLRKETGEACKRWEAAECLVAGFVALGLSIPIFIFCEW